MSILRVTEPFAVLSDPSGRVYSVGDLVEDSDPVVKNRANFFEPVEGHLVEALRPARPKRRRLRARTETASAAPAEVRDLLIEQEAVLSAIEAQVAEPEPTEIPTSTETPEKDA